MRHHAITSVSTVVLAALFTANSHAQQTPAAATSSDAAKDKAVKQDASVTLLSKGTDKTWQNYLLDDAAAHVSAASMAGIAQSAVTIAESTRDFGLLMQAVDPKNKGGGIAITPARTRHPFPKINLNDYLTNTLWLQPVVNLTLSYAQGVSDTDAAKYRRRGVAISTNGTFDKKDDPVQVRVKTLECADSAITAAASAATAASGPIVPNPGPNRPTTAPNTGLSEAITACEKAETKKFDARWFRPVWSVTIATGDVALDSSGASSVGSGTSAVLAARYGRGFSKSLAAAASDAKPSEATEPDFDWGWALSASARYNHREPVLSSVGSGSVQRQSSNLFAIRAAAGTDTVRLLGEASNASTRAVQGGEQTLKSALGIDYRVAPGTWLNFRYGRREKTSGNGDESAGLLTLTLSPSALMVN
jgi:hypothetical protein